MGMLTSWLSSLALSISAQAQGCPLPSFEISDLKVGDGTLDRGFPGGISLADIDGDGDLDVMATRGYDTTSQERPRRPDRDMLYLNDGRGNFSHALDSALSHADTFSSGSTWADVDGDGDLDAFVSTQIKQPDLFFRNLGGGRFERQPLGEATETEASNFTSSWVDIDGDGDLDLYVGGPTLELSGPNLIYRNDEGRFVRVTGLPIENGTSNGATVLWADFDNDGDPDLLSANTDILRLSGLDPAEREHPALFRNEGGWRFTEVTDQSFDGFPATAAAAGDVDNDGDLDLFLGAYAFSEENPKRDRLFLNDGTGRFLESEGFPSPEHGSLGVGAAFADFDLDGDLDLIASSYREGIEIYLNDGSGRFTRTGETALAERHSAHYGISTGDIDADGDLDVVIGYWGETPGGSFGTILRNVSPRCGDWAEIHLVDGNGAPNPPGARVTLVTRDSAGRQRRQLREASAQTGFRSQAASFFLFGLPPGEEIAGAEVRWPDGTVQRIGGLPRNRRLTVRAE